MRLWPALLAVALGACIEANLTVCPGYDCAPTEVCDLAHHGCATQGQLDACAGSPDFTPCTSEAVSGECFDQVCLVPGCGNRVVEPGEQCDDGNHVSGDGCSLDCTSTEKCGNGVVDVARGEQCDDGNLINHDGCNSQCQPETLVYGAIPVRPTNIQQRVAAFDAARGKLVYASNATTWELIGTTWQIASLRQDVVDAWNVLVYDPDLHRVIGFGFKRGGTVAAEWDGATWTALGTPAGMDPGYVMAAAYDTRRAMIVVIGYSAATYLDVAHLAWQDPIPRPQSGPDAFAAYDDAIGQLVVLPNTLGATWVLDAQGTWTQYPTRPPADQNWALAYAPSRGVVALGGATAITPDASISVWQSNQWVAAGTLAHPRAGSVVWFDPNASALELYGGHDGADDVDDVSEVTAAGQTSTPYAEPHDPANIGYDRAHHRFLYVTTQPHAWTWDGAWHDDGQAPRVTTLVFDPARAGLVASDDSTTWKFDTGWSAIGPSPPYSTPAVTYDYTNRQELAVTGQGSVELAPTATFWSGAGPGTNAQSAAYDLGAQHVVALDGSTDGSLADFVTGHWQPTLSPGLGYVVTSWFARRSIVMLPVFGGPNERDVFERRDGVFTSLGVSPSTAFMATTATEMANGVVALAGNDGGSAYVLTLQYASSLPDETCVPGEDADGDGLSGCDDPDCWEQCWPACPYATACP